MNRGIEQFISATSVLVTPDAGGEATCEEEQPSCAPFTLTQRGSTWSHPEICGSISSCARRFFNPKPDAYIFGSAGGSSSLVTVGARTCPQWCGWEMDFRRSDGTLSFASTYLKGGSHTGWPTYSFSNYVIAGKLLDIRPTPPPTPLPPKQGGTFELHLSGDLALSEQGDGSCSGYAFSYLRAHPAPAGTTLRLLQLQWPQDGDAYLVIQIWPSPATVQDYEGKISSLPLNQDRWDLSFSGTLKRSGQAGQEAVTGTVRCD